MWRKVCWLSCVFVMIPKILAGCLALLCKTPRGVQAITFDDRRLTL